MAIFFTIVVVVVGLEQIMEVYGLDLGRYICLAMQALRPTHLLPLRTGSYSKHVLEVVDLAVKKKSQLISMAPLGFEPRPDVFISRLHHHWATETCVFTLGGSMCNLAGSSGMWRERGHLVQ